jgi:molecular chaperone DnaK
MVREAKDHEDDDRQKREMIEARNKLDSLIYQSEKMLDDMSDKISEADQSAAGDAITAAQAALGSDDKKSIEDATTVLESALHSLAQTMYAAQASETGPESADAPTGEADGDDVIDAEIIEE